MDPTVQEDPWSQLERMAEHQDVGRRPLGKVVGLRYEVRSSRLNLYIYGLFSVLLLFKIVYNVLKIVLIESATRSRPVTLDNACKS